VFHPSLRFVIALVFLACPALLDVGLRFHADHMPLPQPGLEPGVACGIRDSFLPDASSSGEAEPHPARSRGSGGLLAQDLDGECFSPAGAGARLDFPTSSTNSISLPAGLLSNPWSVPPPLVSLLDALRTPPVGAPPCASIFHPPRLS
jgi:hypothetical protein